ncbi:unnamed protein product [Heterobilharzia americana]|nr:unnamed protein product [Heterobilharzia americana]
MEVMFKNSWNLFICLLIFRFLNALLIQTSYVPDEYWQSIEVAHKWVFAYGSLTWEWQPDIALRSPFHPLLISLLYRFISLLGIDSQWFIMKSPQILHGCLAAVGDFHLYKFVHQLSGYEVAKWALFHHMFNWFTIYCAPRSLSNCLEWCLCIIGLSYYPWNVACQTNTVFTPTISSTRSDKSRRFIFIAVICVLLRPTALVIWFPLCIWHIWRKCVADGLRSGINCCDIKAHKHNSSNKHFRNRFIHQIAIYISIIIPCITFSCVLDRWTFNKWTINQWNFIKFNILSGGSGVYGVLPWHWIKYPNTSQSQLFRDPCGICLLVTLWTIMCYSFLSHKEFRFLFPIIPLAMYFCGVVSAWFIRYRFGLKFLRSQYYRRHWLIWFIILTQIPVALYTCLIHQRGGLDAIRFIDQAMSLKQLKNERTTVLCLTPCHTVPSVGYLHRNISFKQLSCDPDLTQLIPNNYQYIDEADLFYENPKLWLENYLTSLNPGLKIDLQRPTFILFFDHLISTYESVESFLISRNYKLCGKLFLLI